MVDECLTKLIADTLVTASATAIAADQMSVAPVVSRGITANTERNLIVGVHGQHGSVAVRSSPVHFLAFVVETEHGPLFEVETNMVSFLIERANVECDVGVWIFDGCRLTEDEHQF